MNDVIKCLPAVAVGSAINIILFHDWFITIGAAGAAIGILALIYKWVLPQYHDKKTSRS